MQMEESVDITVMMPTEDGDDSELQHLEQQPQQFNQSTSQQQPPCGQMWWITDSRYLLFIAFTMTLQMAASESIMANYPNSPGTRAFIWWILVVATVVFAFLILGIVPWVQAHQMQRRRQLGEDDAV
jgi:hypothetical protein